VFRATERVRLTGTRYRREVASGLAVTGAVSGGTVVCGSAALIDECEAVTIMSAANATTVGEFLPRVRAGPNECQPGTDETADPTMADC